MAEVSWARERTESVARETCPSRTLFHRWPVSGIHFHSLVGGKSQKRHLQVMLRGPPEITLGATWGVVHGGGGRSKLYLIVWIRLTFVDQGHHQSGRW